MHQQIVIDRPNSSPPVPLAAEEFDESLALAEAFTHHQAGRNAEAERLYRMILSFHPTHAVANYSLGFVCNVQGRLQEAMDAYRLTIAIQPGFVDAYTNLGTVLLTLGQPEQAVEFYRQAIAISPDNALALGNLGKVFQDLGRIDEAVASYRKALSHQPDNAVVNANLGGGLLEQQAWGESEAFSRRAIALNPNNALAHANLGAALLNLGRNEEALIACRQAMVLQPQSGAAQASLGGAMLELGALDEGEMLCRNATALDPALPTGYFNLSHALQAKNRVDEAASAARQAIALRPDSAEFHFQLADLLLLRGELKEGWAEYDWRWGLPSFRWFSVIHGIFSQPRWAGEDIGDKTILIYTEQGLGDIVQFARYLPLVVRKAGRVIVAAHPPLRRLLETIAGITIVSVLETPLPPFDVHCPLLSLPRAFATELETIPAAVPYLHVDPAEQARWDERIGGDRLRVGIVWAGNPLTKRDNVRSPGFKSVAPLFSVPGIDFIVLQVGPGRNDFDPAQLPAHVLDLGQEVTDLADTAAIMSGLDLMISSCTGPLHLAGALGVPTWAMIPFAPYFPWLLERTDSPWYPSILLYRQEQSGHDWSAVVHRIAADLNAWACSAPGPSRRSPTASQVAPPAQAVPLPHDAGTAESIAISAAQENAVPAYPALDPGGFNELASCRSGTFLFNRNDIYIGASLRKYGEFSHGETVLFDIFVRPGMTVLDIGANIGVHTVDLSRLVGATGVVHAFEPQRLMFQVLCANVALNSCANVFTHNAAAGATNGTLLVPSLNPHVSGNYGGLPLQGAHHGETVSLVTIDGMDLGSCHIIKLDVEGMETEALRGAAATVRGFRPILYVENDRQARSAELIGLIQSYGYRLYWHFPPLYSASNFRSDPENIFGNTISVNMLCVPAEFPQSALTVLREVMSPTDLWHQG